MNEASCQPLLTVDEYGGNLRWWAIFQHTIIFDAHWELRRHRQLLFPYRKRNFMRQRRPRIPLYHMLKSLSSLMGLSNAEVALHASNTSLNERYNLIETLGKHKLSGTRISQFYQALSSSIVSQKLFIISLFRYGICFCAEPIFER